MKQQITTIACALFVAGFAAGCGGDDPVAPGPTPQPAATKDEISIKMQSGGTFVGVHKFFGFSNAGDCRVHANYAVYIKPIWE